MKHNAARANGRGAVPTAPVGPQAPTWAVGDVQAHQGRRSVGDATGAHPSIPPRAGIPHPRIPNYVEFCTVAERHSALWEVTYTYDQAAPYRARHRVCGVTIDTSDLEVFDHLLASMQPPSYARPYIDCVRSLEVAP